MVLFKIFLFKMNGCSVILWIFFSQIWYIFSVFFFLSKSFIRLLLLKMIKCEETSHYLFYLHFTFLTLRFHNNHILNTSYPRGKMCLVEKASSWTTIWRIIFTSCYIHSLTTRANVHGEKKGANISMYTVFIHNYSAKTHN